MWWKILGWGGMVLFGIGVIATGGALAAGAAIPLGIITLSGGGAAAFCIGAGAALTVGGAVATYREVRDSPLERQIAANNQVIATLSSQLLAEQANVARLTRSLQLANNNVRDLRRHDDQLGRDLQAAQQRLNQLEQLLQARLQENIELQRRIEEIGGGNSISNIYYQNSYYSSWHLDNYLTSLINNKLGGFENEFLMERKFADSSGGNYQLMLLPSITSDKTSIEKLNSYVNNSSFELLLNRINANNDGKIIFPYLDLIKRHWHTAELIIRENSSNYIIASFIHDPRGGGKMPEELANKIQCIINSKIQKLYPGAAPVFNTYESPYKTCRQSKADKISCGPVIAREIEMRIRGKNLDRSIPYEFGASELVTKQQKTTDTLNMIAFKRYQFLMNNSLTNKNNLEEKPLDKVVPPSSLNKR